MLENVSWVQPFEWLKLNFASCVVQQYIRRVRIIWFLWTKPTIWLLILSFTQNIVRACSMFYPYEGYLYRSVTPLDAARVDRTIFHNHSVHWYYITLILKKIIISWKTSAVSTTVWMVETQLCKLRGTSDTFVKKMKNVSCEYNHLNGWNSTLQAAWYIRRVRIIWFLRIL